MRPKDPKWMVILYIHFEILRVQQLFFSILRLSQNSHTTDTMAPKRWDRKWTRVYQRQKNNYYNHVRGKPKQFDNMLEGLAWENKKNYFANRADRLYRWREYRRKVATNNVRKILRQNQASARITRWIRWRQQQRFRFKRLR